jgi:sporulation protein YqfC
MKGFREVAESGKSKLMKREQKIRHKAQQLAMGMDYPVDALLDTPSIHLTGKNIMVVEGCKGVLLYTESKLTVDMGDYAVTVHGRGMVLKNLSKVELTVHGNISAITYDGREVKE